MVSSPAKRSRSTSRKFSKKKSSTRVISISRPRFPGFPKQLGITMRYVQRNNFVLAASTTPVTKQWSTNGLFQPDAAGGGSSHQPMQFDTMSGLYGMYTVLSSRMTVTFNTEGGNNQVCGAYIEDNNSIVPSTLEALVEQSSATWTNINGQLEGSPRSVTLKWSAKDTFGGNIRDNDNLMGTSAANPPTQNWFTVFIASNSASIGANVRAMIVIEYDCIWDLLYNQNSS